MPCKVWRRRRHYALGLTDMMISLASVGFARPTNVGPNVVRETLVIEEWVVDFLRPTFDSRAALRKEPFHIPEAQRAVKYMMNGSYPGPTIHANENDLLELTVVNKLFSEATTIHWHGIHPLNQPARSSQPLTTLPTGTACSLTGRHTDPSARPPSHFECVCARRGSTWTGLGTCTPRRPSTSGPTHLRFPTCS